MGHKGPVYKAWVHWDRKGSNPMLINQSMTIWQRRPLLGS